MSLRDYSIRELAAEIRRRQMEDDPQRERLWCSECIHFKSWTKSTDAPDSYNPCEKHHKMTFQCPAWDWMGDNTGFHRPGCKDRVQMTQEQIDAEAARLQEIWSWEFRHLTGPILPRAAKLPQNSACAPK